MILGKVSRKGTCAICKKDFGVGTMVYFDQTKSQGMHLAHKDCWDKLVEERGPRPADRKAPKKSTEKLDPPF